MAITRTDINGDIAALKAALETLVPDFFASVEYDDAESPTTVICKDADENTIFEYYIGGPNVFGMKAYKNAETYVGVAQATGTTWKPLYFYKVGSNGAVIQLPNSLFIIIAKTNTGKTGFALYPQLFTTAAQTITVVASACWGDDPALSNWILICGSGSGTSATSTLSIGNHTLFVPVPMHGTYEQNIFLPKAFFIPMAQDGMRGVVRELSTDSGTYLTNGYVALLDDSAVN